MALKGIFSPPGDKSISHRLAIMSLLASGEMTLTNFSPCADVLSSLEAVTVLGGSVRTEGEKLVIQGAEGRLVPEAFVDCGNSGTTMRLLMGVLAGRPGRFTLDGDDSLRKRPMERVALPLRKMGAEILTNSGKCPLTVLGANLKGIDYDLPVASAQLKSAVLLAGIQADGTTTVREPALSRDHTERLLNLFGARIVDPALRVERSTLILPDSLHVPGDASSAAFFLAAAAIMPDSEVTATEMLLNPTRIGFLNVLRRMGADLEIQPIETPAEPYGTVKARFSRLSACRIESDEIPSLVDEVPILALAATQATGTTVFEGVGELKIKESDRLAAVADQLGRMGAKIHTHDDTLIVDGPTPLKPPIGALNTFHDHRIAMTLRLAAVSAGADPEIEGEESVAISYPGFHQDLKQLCC